MPRITVNVDPDVEAWLEAEADRLGTSKAAAGGRCIELLYSEVDHITDDITQQQSTSDADRLAELEARVAALEDHVDTEDGTQESSATVTNDDTAAVDDDAGDDETDDPSNDAGHHVRERTHDPEALRQATFEDPSGRLGVAGLTDALEASADASDERLRREAIRVAEWLREQEGRFKKGALQDALAPDDLSDRVWWERYARPALKAMRACDVVDYRSGHHDYRWTGPR